jgi:hypothetical protein
MRAADDTRRLDAWLPEPVDVDEPAPCVAERRVEVLGDVHERRVRRRSEDFVF